MAGRKSCRWLSPGDRERLVGRLRAGERVVDVAGAFDVSVRTVFRIQNEAALARRSGSGFRLSFEERVEIAIRVEAGQSDSEIARGLGRHRSTVGREIRRCGGRSR